MRGHEARKECPDLILIQVDFNTFSICALLTVKVPTSHGKADLTIYRDARFTIFMKSKIDHKKYCNILIISASIVSILCNRTDFPDIIVERASIDEVYRVGNYLKIYFIGHYIEQVYVDITKDCEKMMQTIVVFFTFILL